ncbi:Bowman-Birk type proteinase inhibitor DE-3-like [Abrus precatorius]|uniref:Bowman-Birk type proteinase inhibitor DE-3-like n=1 Tax=Abrus precatorius TaxID=3816 RepID=A0A8B8LN95_ABRPR|nr:Bowman-Birk type proteinase inhibitor DE-3-like [Abrus precatorius]
MMMLKVSFLLLILVGITNAGMELGMLKSERHHHSSEDEPSESSKPCCDLCACTKSIPPQCRCADVRLGSCHSACKTCICALSYPPQCRCVDTTDFCYEPCKSSDDD